MSNDEHHFMYLLAISTSSSEKYLLRYFPHIFDWVVCFSGIELHELLDILEITPLSIVSFPIIFCHSEGCLLTWLIVSFAVQKFSNLIMSHLFTFAFISVTLGGGSQRILLYLCHQVFCLCFPLRVL